MTIENEIQYKQAFAEFDTLIAQMNNDIGVQQQARILAEAIQEYEQTTMSFPKPTTLAGMIEWKMYEMKLKQKDLARLLDIEPSRMSEVLSGKRAVTLDLAKRLHEKLGIDGNFILETA